MTQSEYVLYLFDTNAGTASGISDVITISTPMDISWPDPDYCGGYSYSITYVSGPSNAPKYKELDVDGNQIGDLSSTTYDQIEQEINAIWVNTDGQLTL